MPLPVICCFAFLNIHTPFERGLEGRKQKSPGGWMPGLFAEAKGRDKELLCV